MLDECTDISDAEIIFESLDIINKILFKLLDWIEGEGLNDELVDYLIKMFPSFKEADYVGKEEFLVPISQKQSVGVLDLSFFQVLIYYFL